LKPWKILQQELDFIKYCLKAAANVLLKVFEREYNVGDYSVKQNFKNEIGNMSKVSKNHRAALEHAKGGGRLTDFA
jgi:hypothetical protein